MSKAADTTPVSPRSRTKSLKESITPWNLGKEGHPINLLHLALPDANEQSTAFAEHSLKTVFFSMAILTVSVTILNRLHLSLGWSAAALALAAFAIRSRVEALRETFYADVERMRVEGHENEAESVEWVNGFVSTIWPLIDPGLFNVLIDLLHQFLDEHKPSIVTSTRVSDLDIGTNAMRMLSFRLLPHDATVGDSAVPNEAARDQCLDHVNLEVDFLYSIPPPEKPRVKNIRFMIHLTFGVKKAAFDVPVSVKVTHISGKIRLRLSLTSDPPFVTHTQISFPFMPHLRITARPLKTVNVMNVPGISHYILSALRDVVKVFVAPKSWTLDVSRFLMNSEIQLSPQSQGVIVLRLGRLTAKHDEANDELLYINVELSTSAKPSYTTRALRRSEAELLFGETAFVLVPRDTLMREESLRISLYSKMPTQPADRCLDTVVVPLSRLADAAEGHEERDSEFTEDFELHWQAAYFGIAPSARPPSSNADSRAALYAQRIQEMLDSAVAPPAELVTGLLAVQIHSVANIDLETLSCAVFLDGQLKFRTPVAASVYVNKTVEVLCLDRLHSVVTVAVLDGDGHLKGALSLRLSTLFSYRSQATRWYALAGTESGRIRLSTLFKPLAIHLPPPLLTPDLGTVYIHAISARNLQQFAGHVRVRLSSSGFTAVTLDSGSSPEFVNERFSSDPNKHEIRWPMDEIIPVPVCSRQQTTMHLELIHEDGHGATQYHACYHLSSLGEKEEREIVTLALSNSNERALISRSLSDFALDKLHPSPEKKKKTKSQTPPFASREPSPVRPSSTQPQIRLELRFEGGASEYFKKLAEVWPAQASLDAALGLEATTLAEKIPPVSKPGAPPGEDHSQWGDVDIPVSPQRQGRPVNKKRSSSNDDNGTKPLKKNGPMSWAKSSYKSLSGKNKKA